MPSFGTSESRVFTATGPLELKGETVEVCPTCEDSENGPCRFHVISKDHKGARLVCPNCGDQKSVLIEQLRMLADGPNPRAPIGPPTDPNEPALKDVRPPQPAPGSQTAAIVGRLMAEQANAVARAKKPAKPTAKTKTARAKPAKRPAKKATSKGRKGS